MSFEIKMPKLSDTMEEGTVIRWIVEAGQSVVSGDPIAEVETDKADVEIEAERSGVIREIVVPEGGAARVGAVIAMLAEATGDTAHVSSAADSNSTKRSVPGDRDTSVSSRKGAAAKVSHLGVASSADGSESTAVDSDSPSVEATMSRAATPGAERLASSVAREVAERGGVDLASIRGSGPGGRIVKSDVESALLARGGAPVSAGPSSTSPGVDDSGVDEPMSRMRRTIAARMEKSKREIPHFYLRSEVDAGELVRLYETMRKDELIAGVKLTHLLLRAIGLTLPQHPRLNAFWVEDSIELVEDVNIGIVVALDDGLLVPVLKRAQYLGLRELVSQSQSLVERARKGKFRSDDLVGATISVSNIGMLDVDEVTPIINAPQASIVGVGATRECPMVRDGQVVAGLAMTITLACDHRVVGGVEAGRFLEDLKHLLERPLSLILD